jgi:hypothetical protein
MYMRVAIQEGVEVMYMRVTIQEGLEVMYMRVTIQEGLEVMYSVTRMYITSTPSCIGPNLSFELSTETSGAGTVHPFDVTEFLFSHKRHFTISRVRCFL